MEDQIANGKRPEPHVTEERSAQRNTLLSLCTGDCSNIHGSSPLEHQGSPWHSGIVVVEFENPLEPEVFFPAGGGNDGMNGAERHSLIPHVLKILDTHNATKAELTFSFDSLEKRVDLDRERFITFHFPPSEDPNLWEIADKFARLKGVVYAAPEPKLAPSVALLDEPLAIDGGCALGKILVNRVSKLQNQWYLFRCRADVPLRQGILGEGVVVADVDWGFRIDHDELKTRVFHSWSVPKNGVDVSGGVDAHGTGVLGIIGAADNDLGMIGFAPKAKLWAIQADDGLGAINNDRWVKAIDHVRDESSGSDRKIILIEGSTDRGGNIEASIVIRKAITNAIDSKNNIVVCVAAGNRGIDADLTDDLRHVIPQTGTIMIGATQYRDDPKDMRRGASNFGLRIVVSAPGDPGGDVTCCACKTNSYSNSFGGTSGAAAKVAGAIALMLQVNRRLTHKEIREILGSCGPPITYDISQPMGRFLDVEAAVNAARMRQPKHKWFHYLLQALSSIFIKSGRRHRRS